MCYMCGSGITFRPPQPKCEVKGCEKESATFIRGLGWRCWGHIERKEVKE